MANFTPGIPVNEEMTALMNSIKHAREVAQNTCGQCSVDHMRLADWLTELYERKNNNE